LDHRCTASPQVLLNRGTEPGIRELRDRINQRPFRKREGSRASQFMAVDKPH